MADAHSSSSRSESSSATAASVARPVEYCRGRHAGVLLPLFCSPSTRSWGIGEIGDLPIVARWLREAGLDLIQMLPVNEMAFGQNSPYSALSAMAIDPLFLSLADVPEFQALGGEGALSPATRARLDAVRRAPGVAYGDVRSLKDDALRASFARFRETNGARAPGLHRAAGDAADMPPGPGSPERALAGTHEVLSTPEAHSARAGGRDRQRAFEEFRADAHWWLADYALFRALHERHAHRAWWTWDPALQARDEAALDRARAELADEVRYYEFQQWLAAEQWQAAREGAAPVGFFGDLPFTVGADSADVWAHHDVFARDLSVGTPPDAFSATGQDWGLPAYRWDFMAAADFRWLRERARRARELFDGFRIDHVIGFYRTYVRPIPLPVRETGTEAGRQAEHEAHAAAAAAAAARAPFFTPAAEHEQRALGEHILGLLRESGACIIAEDLGTVPDFVRESLARLQVPGYRVLRWERDWHQAGQPFRHPAHYPARSLATTGTHDTDPLAIWWDTAPPEERREVAALAGLMHDRGAGGDHPADENDRDGASRDGVGHDGLGHDGAGHSGAGHSGAGHSGADQDGGRSDRAHADVAARAFDTGVRDAVLRLLYASGSDLLVLPVQDLFGWRDRINTPATVGDTNWTWRLPWPVDTLEDQPEARARAAALRAWALEFHRAVDLLRED